MTDLTPEQRIAQLEEELRDAKHYKEMLDSLPEPRRIATLLHDRFCRSNHTNGCGWEYEGSGNSANWDRHAHKRWLEKGHEFMNMVRKLQKDAPDLSLVELCQYLISSWPNLR